MGPGDRSADFTGACAAAYQRFSNLKRSDNQPIPALDEAGQGRPDI